MYLRNPKTRATSTDEPIVRARLLEGFDAFIARRGVRFADVLREVDADPATLSDPDGEVPLNTAALILEAAARQTGDSALGIAWAEAYPVGGTGIIAYLMLNTRTLREALQTGARFSPLLFTGIDVRFDEADRGILSWQWPPSFTAPRAQLSNFLVSLTIKRMNDVLERPLKPLVVEVDHRGVGLGDERSRLLGHNIITNAARMAVHFDKASLNMPLIGADPRLHDIVREFGERALDELPKHRGIVPKVREAIVGCFAQGPVTVFTAARALDMTPSSLTTHLANAGTNFEAVLEDTRRALAERHLRDTDLTLTNIASRLGYSELSVFTRAAQRWFGMAPSDYRRQIRS